MVKVAGLALPFFGLIFLGYLAGRIWRREENALVWLNIFVLYFALPALFFQLISRTPVQQLANWSFVFSTSLATYTAFAIAFAFAVLKSRGNLWIHTGVMMASLPPAATIYVIATQYNTYILRGSSAILLGTAASVFTVTGVLYLISNNLLPLDLFAR